MSRRAWKGLGVGVLMSLIPCLTLYAEEVTVTTYYPSPRGVYDQLRSNSQYVRGGSGHVGSGLPDVNDILTLVNWLLPANYSAATDSVLTPLTLNQYAAYDINGDGVVNQMDLDLMRLVAASTLTVQQASDTGKYLIGTLVSPTLGGWVGIGTTSPAARLDVEGKGTTSATTTLRVADASNTPLLLVRDDGKVGIGTTSPTYDLSFGGDVGRVITMELASTGPGQILNLMAGGAASGSINQNGGDLYLGSGAVSGSGTSSILFFTAGGNPPGAVHFGAETTPRMTIDGFGNVGIGKTPDPGFKLDVNGPMQFGGSGLPDDVIQTTGNMVLQPTGNAGIGQSPTFTGSSTGAASPGNSVATNNLDVNDVWLRAANGGAGRWATQVVSVQHGFFSTGASSGTVTFPVPFSSIPAVVISVDQTPNAWGEIYYCGVTSRTTTNFTFTCNFPFGRPAGPSRGISWFAAD